MQITAGSGAGSHSCATLQRAVTSGCARLTQRALAPSPWVCRQRRGQPAPAGGAGSRSGALLQHAGGLLVQGMHSMYLTAKSGCAGNAGDSLQLREVLAAAAAPYFGMLQACLFRACTACI